MTISTISEWKIDTSAGAPILMYKNCSVIESEQAEYVLSLIRNAEQPVLAVREAQSLGGIRVGNLPTMNQDEYPGLPDWWVQLRIGTDGDEVLARIYGSTPHEAMMRARAIAAQPAPSVIDERAAFSAWNNEDNLPIAGVPAKNAAWLAWQARATLQLSSNSPVIPDGWKLVPNEPTTKQWAAGYKAMDGGIDKVTLAYRAMVEVAPSPGGADDSHATAT